MVTAEMGVVVLLGTAREITNPCTRLFGDTTS